MNKSTKVSCLATVSRFLRVMYINNVFSSLQGRTVDYLYALFVHKLFPSGSFFCGGWGQLHLEWIQEKSQKFEWPPPEILVSMHCVCFHN